eukprot:CAMPEP_0181182856 /NCGR_PEP_ID=MMETSP1096-20121128/8109_1 /TAXON_ID=156174 ORGANISM="Chrysochromulina ericina, Strain CCMP281" /NCGR_SAMPLE_ID=MMETSP1096 /ASSEMBLY_ACC=CAM_ASM_000453 /LENGTH=111 /DNA_ID=CAMNT_0023271485 /DNA_START=48 /DNA_END=381 /DNA_ORIENTATION=+
MAVPPMDPCVPGATLCLCCKGTVSPLQSTQAEHVFDKFNLGFMHHTDQGRWRLAMPHYSLYASSVLSSLPLAGLATDNTPFAGLATDAIALAGLATDARSTLSSCSKACRW